MKDDRERYLKRAEAVLERAAELKPLFEPAPPTPPREPLWSRLTMGLAKALGAR